VNLKSLHIKLVLCPVSNMLITKVARPNSDRMTPLIGHHWLMTNYEPRVGTDMWINILSLGRLFFWGVGGMS